MELLEGLLQRDREEFKRIGNKLLSVCFLCRSNAASRQEYYFVVKHKDKFAEYFGVLGYRLEINEEYGVVQLTNPQNYNRLNLKLIDSIVLLILRILFDEKKRELSASDEVIVNVGDIHDRYLSLKIRDKMIGQTDLRNALSQFRRFQLIEVLDKDLSNADTRLIIYNSILMAVRVEDIKQACDKLEIYRKGTKEDEETDADEID